MLTLDAQNGRRGRKAQQLCPLLTASRGQETAAHAFAALAARFVADPKILFTIAREACGERRPRHGEATARNPRSD
jgi:hypothetical protein